MNCDEVLVVDAYGLSFAEADLEVILKQEEIPYYKERDGTFYFTSKYSRDRAKTLYLRAIISETDETLPQGCF